MDPRLRTLSFSLPVKTSEWIVLFSGSVRESRSGSARARARSRITCRSRFIDTAYEGTKVDERALPCRCDECVGHKIHVPAGFIRERKKSIPRRSEERERLFCNNAPSTRCVTHSACIMAVGVPPPKYAEAALDNSHVVTTLRNTRRARGKFVELEIIPNGGIDVRLRKESLIPRNDSLFKYVFCLMSGIIYFFFYVARILPTRYE